MQHLFPSELHSSDQPVPFTVTYADGSRPSQLLTDDRVMALIRFGTATGIDTRDSRLITVGLPQVDGHSTWEVWHSPYPLQRGNEDCIYWTRNQELLFAHLLVDETPYPDLEAASHDIYHRILDFGQRQGYPYLLRIWNYFPNINREFNDLERYRAFCLGRYRVLEVNPNFEAMLPAACAIGTSSPGFLLYWLAARQPGMQIENPRQTSAFRYPPQYGPRSPSFSRAVLKSWGADMAHLYISGTASIVNHRTHHPDDTLGQLQETLANLDALLAEANRQWAKPFEIALLKTYLRPDLDVAVIKSCIHRHFGNHIPVIMLQGDICRDDLLLEIEGMAVA